MASAKAWAERIAEWRASGLTAAEFAEGRPFSAQQMWNWAWRLRRDGVPPHAPVPAPPGGESRAKPRGATKCVRLARVVRVAAAAQPSVSSAGVVVDVRGVRIAVPTGFDRGTFAAVLDEVERCTSRSGLR